MSGTIETLPAPRVAFEAGMHTGEGPVWDARTGRLHCVDCTNPAIWTFDAHGRVLDRMALAERIGFVALTERPGRLVAGLATGLHLIDLEPRRTQPVLDPEPDLPGNRLNDGTVDLDGSLVFGSLDDALVAPTGRTWRLTPGGELQGIDAGYVVSNGPCAHPDGKRFLFVDSEARLVKVLARGEDGSLTVTGERFCAWDEPAWGVPDGVACDEDGGVWISHWGGSRVSRFDALGTPTHTLALPVSQVTKIAFGGPQHRTLYITSANRDIDCAAEPLAGALFVAEVPFRGVPARHWHVGDGS